MWDGSHRWVTASQSVLLVNPAARASTDREPGGAIPVYALQDPCKAVSACSRNELPKALLPSPERVHGEPVPSASELLRDVSPACAEASANTWGIPIPSVTTSHDDTAHSCPWAATSQSVTGRLERSSVRIGQSGPPSPSRHQAPPLGLASVLSMEATRCPAARPGRDCAIATQHIDSM